MSWKLTLTKENLAFGATLLGATGVIIWMVYAYMMYRRERLASEKHDRLLLDMEKQEEELASLAFQLRNIELAQCTNPQVAANPQLSTLLKCPRTPANGAAPPMGALPPAMIAQGGSAMQMGDAGIARPLMPNYGFFGTGPNGMSPPQQPTGSIGMPAFER